MEQQQLDGLVEWFGGYIQQFYSPNGDEFLNSNLQLKQCHTRRVCGCARMLAGELGLDENDARLAETVALLHDIGRFEQFARYRTYKDADSENHSVIGLRVIRENRLLDALSANERQIIETAVEHHNAMRIPQGLDDKTLLQAQIIRDADKLDIFELSTENFRKYHNDPAGFKLEIEFPDEPYCSAGLLESLMRGELVDYRFLRTMNDVMLLEIGWVYDIYFAATLRQVAENRYVERLAEHLPETKDVQRAVKYVLRYMRRRIEQEQKDRAEH
jgi:putative nucleotidyltransferase with HDIG domain